MSISNNVISISGRRKIVEAANRLSRSKPGDVEAFEELLAAIGEQFSEDFGVKCEVVITCDKEALLAKVEALEKENV